MSVSPRLIQSQDLEKGPFRFHVKLAHACRRAVEIICAIALAFSLIGLINSFGEGLILLVGTIASFAVAWPIASIAENVARLGNMRAWEASVTWHKAQVLEGA